MFFVLCLGVSNATAELEIREDSVSVGTPLYGIYNTEKDEWKLLPVMLQIEDLGKYGNNRYFAMMNYNGWWGVVTENRLFNYSPQYEHLKYEVNIFASIGAFVVRKNGKWGVTDIMNREVLPCIYSAIRFKSARSLVAEDNYGNKQLFTTDELRQRQKQICDNNYPTPVRNSTAKPTPKHPNQTVSGKTLELSIIEPKDGSDYNSSPIAVRYSAKLDKQEIEDVITFYVNGKRTQTEEEKATTKGVRPVSAQGREVHLEVPRETGKECHIQVKAEVGGLEKSETVALKYSGEMPKPTLHVWAVGISNYPAEDLTNLTYADKDARDFVETVQSVSSPELYDHTDCNLIPQEKADRETLYSGLRELRRKVRAEDVVILYFSGHGVQDGDDAYFMTVDASADKPYNGLSFLDIRKECEYMTRDKFCKVIIIMDACHSGAMYGLKGVEKPITIAGPGVIGMYSSTQSERSAENDKAQNGLFTKALLEGIKGEAADKEGKITISALFNYILKNVEGQDPLLENKMGGEVVVFKK